jgi:DNA-binding GntR family transcriptional regulator
LVFDPVETSEELEADQRRVHEELVAAARGRDPDSVEDELRRHLERNKATMLEQLGSITSSRAGWVTGDTA